ncbi:2,5-diketo-D-gluconate reductase A [Lutibacter flavus]|uniref:2,5-diketo-D-gluconate reductase A n=1 Tax=Lutibacter flavus TaxID=691689 RepID=A0A238ZBJ8_9FLAO|nr:aldo/keto reductase [Lutibacter flavus]SNR80727.1 2,5-diketo-D-gluconate reductase A [Lutibacter flavus]
MKTKNHQNAVGRREFLKTSAKIATSAVFLSFGGFSLMGAVFPSQNENAIPTILLNNGIKMPMLGFGTNTLNGATCKRCVAEAISVGYRLIDTANIYGNEEFVGAGIKQSGINRDELFITSKLWVDDYGYENAKKGFETSLNKLGVEYLDLYLLHRPRGDVKGAWKALEELHLEGKIRAIGVSNFEPNQFDELMTYAKIKPVINQIETHVFCQQDNSYGFLKKSEVQMEAWSPFAAGRNNIFTNQTLADIGKKYSKSVAQVCLRWHFQRGVIAIPRSSQKIHMIENLNIFDFELDETDMKTIRQLDLNTTQFPEWG